MRSRVLGALAGALAISAAATAASAQASWTVNGTFDDTGTVTGTFDIDVYGYITNWDLTTAGGSLASFEYTPGDSYAASGTVPPPLYNTYVAPFYIDLQPGYAQDLHLVFGNPLNTPSQNNPLIGGGQGFECQGSYGCFIPIGGSTRYIDGGSASAAGGSAAPEPAAWALMIGGFGLAGATLRRRRLALAVVKA